MREINSQNEEGIKSVKWKNLKQVKIKEKTFKNIKIILEIS